MFEMVTLLQEVRKLGIVSQAMAIKRRRTVSLRVQEEVSELQYAHI